MYCFLIEKNDDVPDGSEIRGLDGNGTANYRVMKNVCVRAKPNAQVAQWSAPIYLVHSLPPDGALPGGTPKHHLFKRSTCKGRTLVQSSAELELKLSGLRSSVNSIREKMSTWDAVDTKWWSDFFAARRLMPTDQHGHQTAPPDPTLLSRIKNLFWGVGHVHVLGTIITLPLIAPIVADPAREAALRTLAVICEPVTDPANAGNWGRSRKRDTGYSIVGAGEDVATVRARDAANIVVQKSRVVEEYCKSLQTSRAVNESAFAENLKVS